MHERRRILVIDGSKYFDGPIWDMLVPESDFEIIGLARNTDEALKMATSLYPDVVLVDLSHSGTGGLMAIKSLHVTQAGIPIIALTPISSQEYTQAALDAGAAACLAKSDMVDALLQTIVRLIPAPLASVTGLSLTQKVL